MISKTATTRNESYIEGKVSNLRLSFYGFKVRITHASRDILIMVLAECKSAFKSLNGNNPATYVKIW